jgi:putative membrane protein
MKMEILQNKLLVIGLREVKI